MIFSFFSRRFLTGFDALTLPDREDSPVVNDKPEPEIQTGRQKARAAVMKLHEPSFSRNACQIVQWFGNIRIVENIHCHYAVPPGIQPYGILSDEYRSE